MSKVIVLGTNLEGLLAGHAASIAGHDVYFIEETTEPGGLDFLAAPIPLTMARAIPLHVSDEGSGEPADFFGKLTGGLVTKHFRLPFMGMDGCPIWDPMEVFLQLQKIYASYFREPSAEGIDSELVAALASDAKIVSSVQLPAICKEPDDHNFSWAPLVSVDAVSYGSDQVANVRLSGDPDTPAAIIGSTFFGHKRIYSSSNFPPVSTAKREHSMLPLKTNCDCWPDIIKVGAAAAWQPDYPTHRAFYATFQALDGIG